MFVWLSCRQSRMLGQHTRWPVPNCCGTTTKHGNSEEQKVQPHSEKNYSRSSTPSTHLSWHKLVGIQGSRGGRLKSLVASELPTGIVPQELLCNGDGNGCCGCLILCGDALELLLQQEVILSLVSREVARHHCVASKGWSQGDDAAQHITAQHSMQHPQKRQKGCIHCCLLRPGIQQ